MSIMELLDRENVIVDFDAKNKKDFFEKAVSIIVSKYSHFYYQEVLHMFLEREKTMSTGIGKKIAIPHIIYEKCQTQQLYIFHLRAPIDFKALDQQPVRLIIMLVGPKTESNMPYLQILAKLSRLMKKDAIVEKLLKTKSIEAIVKVLKEYEQR